MNNKNSTLFQIILFILLSNLIFGKSFFETNEFTPAVNVTLDFLNNEVKSSCQSLTDCSEGALKCEKDSNGKNSICIYPLYICSSNENCYLVGKDVDKTSFVYSNNSTVNCTNNDECLSNQCVSGQCQINLNSPNVLCEVENSKYHCQKLTGAEQQINSNNTVRRQKENERGSSSITIYIIIAIGIIVGAVLFGIILKVCYESAQYLDENPEIKELRKENKNAAIVAIL